MSRPFLVKDIALQAGVSAATVDRVLNARTGVRAHMVRRVEQAIAELERQREQVGAVGRKLYIDLVMDTPERFSTLVRAALETEMASLRPVIFRARYALHERWPEAQMVQALEHIATRGSQGVLLKAADTPGLVRAVDRLAARRIPVVTVVTDLPLSRRIAYVGLDNRAAGETAAYLIAQWLGAIRPAGVLVSLSSARFRGEEEREAGFRSAMRRCHPQLAVHDTSEGQGLRERTAALVTEQLHARPDIRAVYSIGGANTAILAAFAAAGRSCACFVGHDLDQDNLALLRSQRISAVLHHDLRRDMRRACGLLMQAHGIAGTAKTGGLSSVDVITPFNIPV